MVFLHWYFIRPDNSEHLQWTSLIGTLGRRLIKKTTTTTTTKHIIEWLTNNFLYLN